MVDFDHGADCNDYLIPRGRHRFCMLHFWNFKEGCVGCQIDESNFSLEYTFISKPKFHGSDPLQ